MSAIANFLQVQHQLGKVTTEQIRALVDNRLTQAEAEAILSGAIAS